MSNARNLIRVCKGKSIVVTSGGSNLYDMRKPQELAAIAQLLGLTPDKAYRSLKSDCQSVILHAQSRRINKATISVQPLK
jgi:ribonuclease P/MRP protein subunit RPP1